MRLWHTPLTENDLRQCLRIAGGATLGFIFCKFFNISNGVFFTVTPVLLLGMVPVMNGHAARQLIAAGVMCALEAELVSGFLSTHPLPMTIVVFLLFLFKFSCMSRGSLFLFGANCVVGFSVMLHFGSYSSTSLNELAADNLFANVMSVVVAYLMNYLIPDATPREPRPAMGPTKQRHRLRHEALLGAAVATSSFLAFQIFDLKDSLSGQVTTVLMLFPMHWNGALGYARKRAIGTLLGVSFGLFVQLLLYSWSDTFVLVIPLLWLGLMCFAYIHVKEASGSGAGFGSMTTVGILFGQYLKPDGDFVFSALYRVSSILFAIIVTLMLTYLIHRLLNRFPATKFGH